MTPTSPTVATWELGLRLREIREHKALNPGSVAKSLGITQTYLSNIEHGRRTIAEEKLFALIELCGADEQRDELLALRRNSDRRGWWSRYNSSLPVELVKLFSYQHGATAIRSYEGCVISGLLQTADYARAIHRGDVANTRPSDVDTRVNARLHSQQRLYSEDPLRATIIMSEATLWQQVGGTAVLAGQLEHLLALLEQLPETLDVRILPFTEGSCGALGSGTFHLLEFAAQRVRRLAWHETVTSLQLLDDEARIHCYDLCFAEALDHAADPDTSKKLITDALEQIT